MTEQTNLGPIMDAAIARVRRRMQPAGLDADYDLAYDHFDLTHFLLQARPLLSTDDVDPLGSFLANGARAKASPEINFRMQSYIARYPEKVNGPERSPYLEWLKRGKAAGEIADPAPGLDKMASVLGMEPGEVAKELANTRSDLQKRLRTGVLGDMFARAAEVEPLIADSWTEAARPTIPPLVSASTVDQVATMHACQRAAGYARARLVLVCTGPRWGGGRRVEGHIAHAVTGHLAPRDIVVIYTDQSGTAPPGRFPAGVREIDLASEVEQMDRPGVQRVLVELVRSFHAEAVVNINSRLLYEAMTPYGKALAASERLFLMLFCNEQLAMGNWLGLPLKFFYRCFDLVEGVITDSAYLADWLQERHQLGVEQGGRVHVFRAPVDPHLPVVSPPPWEPSRRPQVFWAGRWDRQKRIDIAFEVARRMPDVDLRMWGESVLTPGHVGEAPGNVRLEGAYAHISELELSDADVWLYTSAWDGAPSQLLEVGMTGIPIVGSLVGGTGEVLGDDDSWPVADLENPDAYVQAIRDVLADQAKARRRSQELRDRLLRERTEEAYADHVAGLLLGGAQPRQGEEAAR
ncbi:MAG TPA: glycosyltransferase family 4 protein [Nocardioidaceae bacterium]|nr:glycosyltransferase family 4 protein [Nocardioidaceae bacterium]